MSNGFKRISFFGGVQETNTLHGSGPKYVALGYHYTHKDMQRKISPPLIPLSKPPGSLPQKQPLLPDFHVKMSV